MLVSVVYVWNMESNAEIITKILKSSDNFCIYGAAGTGKSHIISNLCSLFKVRKLNVSVCATTGAAVNILRDAGIPYTASTLHSWSQCGLCERKKRRLYEKKIASCPIIRECDVLIVDEFSMLSGESFQLISDCLTNALTCSAMVMKKQPSNPREYRQQSGRTKNRLSSFGGIRVLLFGDPYQLPPIDKEYIFLSEAWKSLNLRYCETTTGWRYRGNELWKLFLLRLRKGESTMKDLEDYILPRIHTKSSIGRLEDTVYGKHDEDVGEPKKPLQFLVHLMTLKHSIKQYNSYVAKKYLPNNKSISYPARVSFQYVDNNEDEEEDNDNQNDSTNNSNFGALKYDYDTTLTVGAQIVITRNISVELFNGTMGFVTGLRHDTVYVKTKNHSVHEIKYEMMELACGKKRIVRLHYLPVKMAYAVTAHKAQGAEFSLAVLHLERLFSEGHAYTMLSRVPSPECLRVLTDTTSKQKLLKELNNYNTGGDEFMKLIPSSVNALYGKMKVEPVERTNNVINSDTNLLYETKIKTEPLDTELVNASSNVKLESFEHSYNERKRRIHNDIQDQFDKQFKTFTEIMKS